MRQRQSQERAGRTWPCGWFFGKRRLKDRSECRRRNLLRCFGDLPSLALDLLAWIDKNLPNHFPVRFCLGRFRSKLGGWPCSGAGPARSRQTRPRSCFSSGAEKRRQSLVKPKGRRFGRKLSCPMERRPKSNYRPSAGRS